MVLKRLFLGLWSSWWLSWAHLVASWANLVPRWGSKTGIKSGKKQNQKIYRWTFEIIQKFGQKMKNFENFFGVHMDTSAIVNNVKKNFKIFNFLAKFFSWLVTAPLSKHSLLVCLTNFSPQRYIVCQTLCLANGDFQDSYQGDLGLVKETCLNLQIHLSWNESSSWNLTGNLFLTDGCQSWNWILTSFLDVFSWPAKKWSQRLLSQSCLFCLRTLMACCCCWQGGYLNHIYHWSCS